MFSTVFSIFDKTLKAGCLGLITAYQKLLSPLLGQRCRFYPTCSQYAITALKTHTLLTALWLIGKRLLKCHPFGASGLDLVPDKERKHGHTKN